MERCCGNCRWFGNESTSSWNGHREDWCKCPLPPCVKPPWFKMRENEGADCQCFQPKQEDANER
jgi:hypothetical protein